VPENTANGGAGGSTSGTSGSGHGGGTVANGGMEAGAGEAGAGEAGTGGAITAPGPTHGLLAVAGTDPDKNTDVVSLIDPTTGAELARQTINGASVTGLAYDGSDGKDVWYEFTSGEYPAAPTDKASLQVYAFTDATSTWKAVSSKPLTQLPPPRPNSFVVLNDRLAYLSYDISNNAPVASLTVLDTSDPTAVKVLKDSTFTVSGEVLGLVGTRGVLGDPTAPGGTLAVLIGSTCSGKTKARACANVQILPVAVGDDVSQGVAVSFSATLVGQPAFTSAQTVAAGYVAFTLTPNDTVSLYNFDPRKPQTIGKASPANNAPWTGGLAYAECQDVALFTGVGEQKLYAVTGDAQGGLNDEANLGHAGQSIVYEPYTQHAITLYNPNNAEFADNTTTSTSDAGSGTPSLDSFDVTNKAVLTPTAAASWKPPTNLAPNIAVARFPLSFSCN
jgi:hypothetical protein